MNIAPLGVILTYQTLSSAVEFGCNVGILYSNVSKLPYLLSVTELIFTITIAELWKEGRVS